MKSNRLEMNVTDLDIGDAFPGGYRYDFRKAHFFMKKFGGILIWIRSLDADVDDARRYQ